ncbi:TIGR03617 family F420-dependent LLM class oxidoreductase [Halieaceae bacterium IMCC8485]|jgi:probable F420-dependent oxidoreductase|uniref:TIGR03617 family F420-dependent LLM class oxidoreductase n=1 Tax=Candidatus Seongchinamella marina TaxID=2518990 RepID=A0ABT3SU77_9GAMM|nr:TIGR03617 family F420-dependent LLM class oxidoreductase [Candidatus Seongchinamella marina]MCX2973533.1 TIGR03617 family F420-dependent LLM class oxidoreductase [Candidatus Seongchinamella marina]
MKIDGPFYAQLGDAAAESRRLKTIGYDGIYTLEGSWDPFYPLVMAAEHAPGLDLATGIAVAFPRNPMHLAYQAWDLQKFSNGHFYLGLGSQIKAHIEKRFGIAFDPPASRMREYIQALKAIFDCWQHGSPMDFDGRFYKHTLMTPMFDPGPNPHGIPPVLLGALGPRMTEVAGEVADGLIVHPFNSMRFLQNNAMPAVLRGLEKSGRQRTDFILQINAIVITGETEEAISAATESVKGLLGFYASTPAYRPPMEAVGYEDLQPELNALSKQGKWDALGSYIDDDFLEHFTTRGAPGEIAAKLKDKYGQYADRLAIYAPYAAPDDMWRKIIAELKN